MDSSLQQPQRQEIQKKTGAQRESERFYADWFRVSGDLDDFIFYGEDGPVVSTR